MFVICNPLLGRERDTDRIVLRLRTGLGSTVNFIMMFRETEESCVRACVCVRETDVFPVLSADSIHHCAVILYRSDFKAFCC